MAAILDPGDQARGGPMVPRAELLAEWSGRILLVQPALAVAAEVRPFGLAWFMPALRAQSGWLAGAFGRAFAGDPVSGAGGLQGGVVVQGKGGERPAIQRGFGGGAQLAAVFQNAAQRVVQDLPKRGHGGAPGAQGKVDLTRRLWRRASVDRGLGHVGFQALGRPIRIHRSGGVAGPRPGDAPVEKGPAGGGRGGIDVEPQLADRFGIWGTGLFGNTDDAPQIQTRHGFAVGFRAAFILS